MWPTEFSYLRKSDCSRFARSSGIFESSIHALLGIARSALDLTDASAAIDWLTALEKRIPRQTRRDATQVEFQQFSTRPAEALLIVGAAGICSLQLCSK